MFYVQNSHQCTLRGRGMTEPHREDFSEVGEWDHATRFCPQPWIKRYHTPLLDTSISLLHTLKKCSRSNIHISIYLKMSLKRGLTNKNINAHHGKRSCCFQYNILWPFTSFLFFSLAHYSHWQLKEQHFNFWNVFKTTAIKAKLNLYKFILSYHFLKVLTWVSTVYQG